MRTSGIDYRLMTIRSRAAIFSRPFSPEVNTDTENNSWRSQPVENALEQASSKNCLTEDMRGMTESRTAND